MIDDKELEKLTKRITDLCGDVAFCVFKLDAKTQETAPLCEGFDNAMMFCPIIQKALKEEKDS